MKERILCAAIHYDDGTKRPHLPRNILTGVVVCGWRHGNCISTFAALLYPNWLKDLRYDEKRIHFLNNHIQGFMTSNGRFVDRKEAMEIALKCGQLPNINDLTDKLYSEDLY